MGTHSLETHRKGQAVEVASLVQIFYACILVPLCLRVSCGCLSASVPFEHASDLQWIVYKKTVEKPIRSKQFLGSTSNWCWSADPDGLNLFYRPCQAPGWLRAGAAVVQLLLSLQGLHFLVLVSQPFLQSCGSGSGVIFPDLYPEPEPCRRGVLNWKKYIPTQ